MNRHACRREQLEDVLVIAFPISDMFVHHSTENHVAPPDEVARRLFAIQIEDAGFEPGGCLF